MMLAHRTLSRRAAPWAAVALGAWMIATPMLAAVPSVINYQGRLTDNSPQQTPVDATVTVEFSVWDSATGGLSLWSETQSVQVVKGLFNVLLGSTTPIAPDVFAGGSTRYLEIHVSGETLTPRQRIAATPFASQAARADDAATLDGVAAGSYQRRIDTPCPEGYSINAVAADGTVTCIVGQAGPPGPPGPPGPGLETGSITGTLTGCTTPYPGVMTYVPGRSAVAFTASDGTFTLSYLPPGTYDVKLGTVGTLNGVVVTSGQATATGPTNLQNISTDVNNCGSCGSVCSLPHASVSCVSGTCTLGTCASGYSNCNGQPADGCEVGTTNSLTDCGGCGLTCSTNNMTGTSCAGGFCGGTCNIGFADCNNNKRLDGCEVNLSTSAANCGACGLACSSNHIPTPTCSAAICSGTCAVGFSDCNGNKQSDGCEVNTGTDANNCGFCGNACPGPTPTCSAGVCV